MSTNKALAVEITANSNQYVQQLEQAARSTETNAKRMQTSLQQFGGNSKAMFQNVGYQINDVAMQIASGGNAIQAVGLQVGQLAQSFGVWGSVVGAAIAVGASFAATMLDTEKATEAAKKATEDYADALDFARQLHETAEQTERRHTEAKKADMLVERRRTLETLNGAKAVAQAELIKAKARQAAAEQAQSSGFLDDNFNRDLEVGVSTNSVAKLEAGIAAAEAEIAKQQKIVDLVTTAPAERPVEQRAVREQKARAPRAEKSTRVKSIEEERDAVEDYIQSLRDSVEVQQLDGREGAIREATMRAQNLAMREGTVLTDAQVGSIQNLAGASYDLAEAQRTAKDETKDHDKLMKELSMTFASAFEDAIIAGKKFSEVLEGIGQDIAKLILRQTVTAPLANAVNGVDWGGMFGSVASSIMGGLSGARAAGGPVEAGGSYLVGEKGPEIVKFNAPGTVIPNHKLGNLGGGGTTVVNQTIQISTGVAATVRSEVLNMLPQIANVTKAAISNDQARKGRSL